jgi:DNA methyltransferase 1-associated protein 1
MNDLKFMFNDEAKTEQDNPRRGKKDIKNDLLKITAGFPSIIPLNKDNNKKEENEKRQKWLWSEFNNPARIDGFRLHHWQRLEDIKKDYEYAQFNKNINIVSLKKDEYDSLCNDLDPSWTWEETDYLWELCRNYDLRFIVIQDKYNFEGKQDRSVEELKERYYSICRKVLEHRKNFDHPILKSGYSYEQEIKRRACLERIINKSTENQNIERELIEQAKEIQEKTDKLQKFDNFENKMVKQIEDQDNAEGTFEEYIKGKPFVNSSFCYLRSYKMNHPVPINEKIQKKIELMLKELNVNEQQIPTERVENAYDILKNNLIIMISLKKHLEKKQKEKKKLEMSYQDIENKISKSKTIQNNSISISNDVDKSLNLNNLGGVKKEKRLKSLGGMNINSNINNIINQKRKNKDDESKTDITMTKRKRKNRGEDFSSTSHFADR